MPLKDEDKLNSEVKGELGTLMFGVQMLLEKTDSVSLKRAHAILCKVNTAIIPPHN